MKESDEANGSPDRMATTDDYLRQVTVGPREPLNSSIDLVPYDPNWPTHFAHLAQRVHQALFEKVLLLEHVGSTSVPGLSAKPVIDMVLAVADSADEPSYVPPLEGQGFVLKIRETDWYEHRLLKASEIKGNLHVFSGGCEEIKRMVAFRDWLRRDEGDRRWYEERKRELAAQVWEYTQNYADAKTEVIQEILARAFR